MVGSTPDHNHPSASAHSNKRKIWREKSKERKHLLKKQRLWETQGQTLRGEIERERESKKVRTSEILKEREREREREGEIDGKKERDRK